MVCNEVICGDCLDLIKNIEDNSVDVVFTSPPYNRKRNDKYEYYSDDLDDYYGFLSKIIDESLRVVKKYVFINIQKTYYNKQDVFRIIGKYYNLISEIFIWEKNNPMPSPGAYITNSHEYIICFSEHKLRSNGTYTKNNIRTNVTNMDKKHKAIMNEEVAGFFIKNFTNPGDIILDPFMGSGTTAKVALKNQRQFIGFEISQEYVDMANKRIKPLLEQQTLM